MRQTFYRTLVRDTIGTTGRELEDTMSAAPVLHDLDEAPGLRAPRGRRGHLRLVHPGELEDTGVGATAPAPTPLRVVPEEPSAPVRMRITRRGRLVVTGTVTLLLAVGVAALVGSVLPAGASTAETVVVQPGQTLSQIAATELPELSLDSAIVQIQLANDMNTLQVQAGQTLEIPGE